METVKQPAPASRRVAPRLLAGVFAGLVGGLAFGVVMSAPAVMGVEDFGGAGMMTLVSRLIGTDNVLAVWGVHLLNSALFGLLFAALVPPRRGWRTVALGLAWGVLLWLLGAFLLLRTLTGTPFRLDAAAGFNLVGHLLYGALLGLAYAAFFREEVGLMRDHPATPRRRASPKP